MLKKEEEEEWLYLPLWTCQPIWRHFTIYGPYGKGLIVVYMRIVLLPLFHFKYVNPILFLKYIFTFLFLYYIETRKGKKYFKKKLYWIDC